MKRLVGFAVVLLFALAGCGSSGSSYGSATDVANAAGLSGCKADTNVISTDAVDCQSGDRVNWFKDDSSLSNWRNIAGAMSTGSEILYGSDWAIECATVTTCKDLKAKLGGDIK